MGMWRSPHRKRKPGKIAGEIWLPIGNDPGRSSKHSSGNEPGKVFRDPQGRLHVVPDKSRAKRAAKKTKGS